MKTFLKTWTGIAVLMLAVSAPAHAQDGVDEVSIDTTPAGGSYETNIWTDMQVFVNTETVVYQQAAGTYTVGDLFVDQGWARATSFRDGDGNPAGGTLGAALAGGLADIGIAWRDLMGDVVVVATDMDAGELIVSTRYFGGTDFTAYYHEPGFTSSFSDVPGTIATVEGGTPVMTLSTLIGTGTVKFDLTTGAFKSGDFAIQFQVTDALAGFWYNHTLDSDFADALVGETVILGFATAGTVTPPSPVTSFDSADATASGFGDTFGGLDFGTYVRAAHDGSFRFRSVPEPGMLALFGLALLVMAGVLRRTRRI